MTYSMLLFLLQMMSEKGAACSLTWLPAFNGHPCSCADMMKCGIGLGLAMLRLAPRLTDILTRFVLCCAPVSYYYYRYLLDGDIERGDYLTSFISTTFDEVSDKTISVSLTLWWCNLLFQRATRRHDLFV